MSERSGYRHGVPCWVAAVEQDPPAAARFYAEVMGWSTEDLMPDGAGEAYIRCRLHGDDVAAVVSTGPAPAPPSAVWATHIWVDSTDEAARAAERAGGTVIAPSFDSPGGARVAVLADPTGAVFCTWEPADHTGARRVNEPGAWAMSSLATGDGERAAAFYGEMFGWRTETFETPDGEMTLFRLPGYVGGEPEQPVSREVIAAMRPLLPAECDAGVGPHWAPDFWIDDAAGAAERAARLGGQVLAEPRDAPPFRRVVLADPEGASFHLSQLMI